MPRPTLGGSLFVSPRGDRARRGATVILLPIPIGTPLMAPSADSGRFPDVHVLHHSILRRLTAMDRLIQAMEAEPTPEQIDEALRHVDAAIVALQPAAHEIDAQRP
jgi:hypothetical protein